MQAIAAVDHINTTKRSVTVIARCLEQGKAAHVALGKVGRLIIKGDAPVIAKNNGLAIAEGDRIGPATPDEAAKARPSSDGVIAHKTG